MKKKETSQRIDKFIWAVRIYKTRSMASDACKTGRVMINDMPAKASKTVSAGETIKVRKPPVIYTYRIKELPPSRVSAKLVDDYIEDQTPEDEKLKLEMKQKARLSYKFKGSGRPTKKERRDLDKFRER